VQSTSESRDLPVLDAVVRYFDEHPEPASLTLDEISELTDRDHMDVYRALKPLAPAFVRLQDVRSDPPNALIWGVTEEARRALGQRRSSMVDQVPLLPEQRDLLAALVEASRNVPAAQREPFMYTETLGGSDIQHPGLPGKELPAYAGDLDVLEGEGLLNVTHRQQGVRMFDVSLRGFRVYEELRRHAGTPLRQVEADLMRYLDSDAFQQAYPEAYRKWSEAAAKLWASDSERQLTTIGHLCREAMQAFATTLVDRHQPPDVDQHKARDVNRIRAVLHQQAARVGSTTTPLLDALVSYWKAVSGLAQRQEHGGQKEGRELVWEDGRRVVFQTAVVMFEIDRALTLTRPAG
jgi:hypothetical protein